MKKRNLSPLIFLCIYALPTFAQAQILVTEMMYDPPGSDSGREWIEVENIGTTSISLSQWRLNEADTNHKIKLDTGSDAIAPLGYAVVADNSTKFLADWPGYSGVLYDSTFSLGNDGDVVILKNPALADGGKGSYSSKNGAAGDGNSLQKETASASFIARSPSPGAGMSASAIPAVVVLAKTSVAKTTKNKKTSKTKSSQGEVAGVANALTDTTDTGDAATDTTLVSADASTTSYDAQSSNQGLYMGMFAVLAIAGVSAVGLIASRKKARNEWDIIEEKPEDV